MGGRGDKSGLKRPRGRPRKVPLAPEVQPEPEKPKDPWEDILGKRSDTPRNLEDAISVTNPHFWEGRQWQINCQRCIWAWEAQRRGYDVEALPNTRDANDNLPYMYDPQGWPNVIKNGGASLVGLPSRNTIVKMDAQMKEWGDGARAIVRVKWKRGNSGHVFVAERRGDTTVYADPQTGKLVNIKSYMDDAVKGETKLLRTDNAEFTNLIEKAVKRRGA